MSQNKPNKIIHLSKVAIANRRPLTGLKITSSKSTKPPDPVLAKKQEEDNLRAELHKEIKWRSRVCAHRGYECTLPVVCGREHCAKHILEDATSPYKQCAHTFPNGEKCPLPAPAPQNTLQDNRRDQGLCFEHARAALASRQRAAAPPPPITTVETLLNQLQHYIRPERARSTSCASAVSVVSEPAPDDSPAAHPLDPFKQIDAVAVNAGACATLMECGSGSDSDADSVTLGRGGNTRGGYDEDLSGDEETPYDREPLRYAGVFTVEEAVLSARETLKLLQAGYAKQLTRLYKSLRSSRKKYLRQLKTEREHYCSINTQARGGGLTARERRQLRKLKAYASYHTRRGVTAVLARKLHRKRLKAADPNAPSRIAAIVRCTFSEGGVRCESRALPAARHCFKHVMEDSQQVLFVKCGDRRVPGGGACREPVAQLPLPTHACRYHTDPPYYTSFSLKRDGDDTDSALSESESDSGRVLEQPLQVEWQVA